MSHIGIPWGFNLGVSFKNLVTFIWEPPPPLKIFIILVSAAKLLQDNSISEALKVQTRLAYFGQVI